MKKILFVCTGNTCRSPIAEAIFNKKAKDRGLELVALSAGLCADGSPISENAKAALEEYGIPGFSHTSVQLAEELISECDYIVGISNRHAAAMLRQYGDKAYKIFSFPTDIPDPYGANLEAYRETLKEIDKGTDAIICEISDK